MPHLSPLQGIRVHHDPYHLLLHTAVNDGADRQREGCLLNLLASGCGGHLERRDVDNLRLGEFVIAC